MGEDDTPSERVVGAVDAAAAEAAPWRARAARLGLPFLETVAVAPAGDDETPPGPAAFTRAEAMMDGAGGGGRLVIAPAEARLAAVADFLDRHPDQRARLAITTPRILRRALVARWAPVLSRRAVGAVLDREPAQSAAGRPSPRALLVPASAVVAFAVGFGGADWLVAGWTVFFMLIGLLRLAMTDARPPPAAHPLPRDALPGFAVLVPLFREARVVDDLVAALGRLDYPADRLEVRLVVEADDGPTWSAAERAVLGTPFDVVVVPPSQPRTKPKALNFALATVASDLVTIYDAEDRPDPDQLRRAAAAFAAGPDDLVVVQAALEIDHATAARPWLVRQFEIEYAMLFHGMLPWLAARRLLLPLGGTSNHFRRTALDAVGGWDPHNVTEDADIAIRLVRAGGRAGVIASATREEAPATWRSWFGQRTRWMKGWFRLFLNSKKHERKQTDMFDFRWRNMRISQPCRNRMLGGRMAP